MLKKSEKKQTKKSVKATEKKKKRNILLIGSEAFPFSGPGVLGETIGSLARALNDSGECDARVILPLYEGIPQEYRAKMKFVCWTFVKLSWRNQYCGLFMLKEGNTVYYFIDNEYYFKRNSLYGYDDDGERFAFFSKAVLDIIPHLDFAPDLLHCNDWQTALVPIYYKLFYMYSNGYEVIKTVFSIHNIEYQGWFNRESIGDLLGIPEHEFASMEHLGRINLLRGVIDYADMISTVSPSYANEITLAEHGNGLDWALQLNKNKLRGILNGIDANEYNPQSDRALAANYSIDDRSGKTVDKAELQKLLWLPINKNVPVIVMIARLVASNGVDIVREALPEIIKRGVQFIVLGAGDSEHEEYFKRMQDEHDDCVRLVTQFDNVFLHKVYAGADILLVPSKIAPCGISQMAACRYGTVPVVRETGGLNDSIVDAYNGDMGNGYKFARYAPDDLVNAIDRAVGLYRDYNDKWQGLMSRAMRSDFSWSESAKEYVKMYSELLNLGN